MPQSIVGIEASQKFPEFSLRGTRSILNWASRPALVQPNSSGYIDQFAGAGASNSVEARSIASSKGREE